VEAFHSALADGKDFSAALQAITIASEAGKESTRNMIAKIGRAARLGERSRGVLDAGATSCYLILNSMVNSIIPILIS
jgi:dihydroxyacetone kinase-like protein